LDVSGNLAVRSGVDTREVLVVTQARLEDTVLVRSRSIVLAADTIEEMLAVVGGVRIQRVTRLETEHVGAHEVVPFNDLDHVGGAVGIALRQAVGEDESTKGVTTFVSTVRVHLSSTVIRVHVDQALLDPTSNLDVGRGLHELDTSKSSFGDDASTPFVGCAPSDGGSLGSSNILIGSRRSPKTEVVNGVDNKSLAVRCRADGSRVANVVTRLRATSGWVGVNLIRQRTPGEVLGGEWGGGNRIILSEGDTSEGSHRSGEEREHYGIELKRIEENV